MKSIGTLLFAVFVGAWILSWAMCFGGGPRKPDPPLLVAARSGDVETVKRLVQSGKQLELYNGIGASAVVLAINRHQLEIAKMVAPLYSEQSRRDENWLEEAFKQRHDAAVVDWLLSSYDWNFKNKNGEGPAFWAARKRDLKGLKKVLHLYGYPEYRNHRGRTAIEVALHELSWFEASKTLYQAERQTNSGTHTRMSR